MMQIKDIRQAIRKFNLQPSIERNFSLILISGCGHAYTKLQRKHVGFTYNALLSYGKKNYFYDLLDEKYISIEIGKLIKKHGDSSINLYLNPLIEDNEKLVREFALTRKKKPEEFFKWLISAYPRFLTNIGVFNCFHRYTRQKEGIGQMSGKLAEFVGKGRDGIAHIYPKIEEEIKRNADLIGKKRGFNGELIWHLTITELMDFLINGKIDKKEVARRLDGYVYFIKEHGDEIVSTDKNAVSFLKRLLMDVKAKNIIKGQTAYNGKVTAEVYNIDTDPIRDFKKGAVLVTLCTHPTQASTIAKASAVVTNEGGILSHPAIIARELKKPAVIGTKNASRILKTGMLVEVDASKGIVRIIS
jgi:phosphohistidine swiveling domain-containing protein